MLDSKAASLVGAISIVGGDKLDKALHDLAAVAKTKDPDVAKSIKLDAEKAAGVRFHVISAADPGRRRKPRQDRASGRAKRWTWRSASPTKPCTLRPAATRLATLKKTIEKSVADGPKPASPFNFSLALGAAGQILWPRCGDAQSRPMAMMFSALFGGSKDQVTSCPRRFPAASRRDWSLRTGDQNRSRSRWRP